MTKTTSANWFDPMRVLIIDDEESVRRITAVALEGMGHETTAVADGQSALQQLGSAEFDAAFLDLKLQEENGIELLPRLLEMRPGLGVIVFSGFATEENAQAAARAGAAGFMGKPFTPQEIRQALGKATVGREPNGKD